MATKKIGETSYKETAFGIIGRSKLIPLEIEGIKRAWDFVLQKQKTGKTQITSEFIKKLHFVGFAWIFPKTGGKFRTIEVVVSKHTPPKSYLIPELMLNFCEDLKTRIKRMPKMTEKDFSNTLIILLAWAHHRFLWIHPFQDYNGRIGRLLTNIILLNLNFPPIELKVETKTGRKRYVSALQEADKGNLNNRTYAP
ncbi:MAG: Fic family protein [bacterium]|nr:Fic family protein [bacterium]